MTIFELPHSHPVRLEFGSCFVSTEISAASHDPKPDSRGSSPGMTNSACMRDRPAYKMVPGEWSE
jgi:hypothetical protein